MADQLAQLGPAELSKLPSMPLPPGATVDFDGPNPLGTTAITVTSVFIGIAFSFVGIRAYTKINIHRRGSWDDLTCALGLISTLLFWVVLLLDIVNEGIGQHIWNVPLVITLSDTFMKLNFVIDWLSNVAQIFVKLTFFILYWNIFKPFRWLKFSIIGGALVVIGVYITLTLIRVVEASPRAGQTWLETDRNACITLSIPSAAWTLVSDLFILLLPISGVLRLQLSPKKRVALLMVFMTGIGACICSSLSIYYRTLLDQDVTYSATKVLILTVVELCVGISITCVSTTSVFLRHILPSVKPLRSTMISYSIKFRGSLPLRQSHASHGNNSHKSGNDGTDGPYRNLRDRELGVKYNEAHDLGVYPAHIVKKNVIAGPFGDLNDDSICLRVEMEQG